ncbi:hypothetical protein MRB53_038334 [Persea americana]|nr:hypothetical protein MRB53_038334 [Persea americana]
MPDNANPLDGWSFPEILQTGSGPASADLYGKLYYYIYSHLKRFHNRLTLYGTDFYFLNVDAKVLKDQDSLTGKMFDRIERLGVLLQTPIDNPYATLLTLFMNAVEEMTRCEHRVARERSHELEKKRARKYFTTSLPNPSPMRHGMIPPSSRWMQHAIVSETLTATSIAIGYTAPLTLPLIVECSTWPPEIAAVLRILELPMYNLESDSSFIVAPRSISTSGHLEEREWVMVARESHTWES